jgi:alpha-N-arabinofuranosidase
MAEVMGARKTSGARLAAAGLLVAVLHAAGRADGNQSPSAEPAGIVVDPGVPARGYDRMIFGGFLEHFDDQVYGGVFDPGSPLADERGFRRDVIAALRELKAPVIRWPGGCFVDAYHWRNGVGKARQPHGDFRWGVIDPNTFGTHEFVEFCRRVGAEPYICLNGLAEPRENLEWVDYCNSTAGPLADLRAANGCPEPLNVRFWSVGNERYDKAYIARVRDTARAMKARHPSVRITCAGSQDGGQVGAYLLEQAGDHLDYLSLHAYWLPRGNELPRFDYLTAVMKSEMPEAFMAAASDALRKAGRERLKIAFDEWNLRAWQHPGFPRDDVRDYASPEIREMVGLRRLQNDVAGQYTLADALFAASFLNACLRHSDSLTMANVAPLVNTRGPLFVHPEGIVRRTHFHALAMYANLLEERVGTARVTSGRLPQDGNSVAVLDAVATVDASGTEWAIALVNRHPSDPLQCSVRIGDTPLDGVHKATVLAGESTDDFNDIEHPDRVVPEEEELSFTNGIATLRPHSLSIVRVRVK